MIFFLLLSLLVTPAEASFPVTVTSYNPAVAQTDSDPCTGAAGIDLCRRSREGGKVIALSQDLVGHSSWKPFRYGDLIRLTSKTPGCSGDFIVLDTMNKRFKNRADIFFLNRADNIGCTGAIAKVQ
jgi:3D (Asp-Asp-Asp) domain-containing protein